MNIPPPPAKILAIDTQLQKALMKALGSNEKIDKTKVWEWVEKVRRFTSFYGHRLRSISNNRFGNQKVDSQLVWMADFMLSSAYLHPDRGALPLDPLLLNGSLFAYSALSKSLNHQDVFTKIALAVQTLKEFHSQRIQQPIMPPMGPSFNPKQANIWGEEASTAPSVVIFCPNPYSLYTLALLQLMHSYGVEIKGIIVRKFTPQRIWAEFQRDSWRIVKKVIRKLILRQDENPEPTLVSNKRILQEIHQTHNNVYKFAEDHQINAFAVARYDQEVVLKWLSQQNADVGCFTGGGMVSPATLAKFNLGVINIHMGHLPYYRGMDVVQWPLLEGRFDNIGATAHFMNEGLDTGPVLQQISIDVRACSSLGALRNIIGGWIPLLHLDTVLGLGSGRISGQKQRKIYRLYYYVHDTLVDIIGDTIIDRPDLRQVNETNTGKLFVETLSIVVSDQAS
ncbi:MAG: hypothetical protein JKX99_11545 [Robiginitomaculum sp.]|nr:hypothetical protein [Robiginitomaculum sp.]